MIVDRAGLLSADCLHHCRVFACTGCCDTRTHTYTSCGVPCSVHAVPICAYPYVLLHAVGGLEKPSRNLLLPHPGVKVDGT